MSTSIASIPTAKQVIHKLHIHDKEFEDPYAWLQNKEDPEVVAYLEAENVYAKAALEHTRDLQETIYQEMRGRIQEDDRSAPERRGDHLYYWRIAKGEQYKVYCRRALGAEAPEEVILDENKLAEGHAYCRVGVFEPSPDGSKLAYGVDTTGAWVFDLSIKDLQTGAILSGPIAQTAWGVAWASDSQTLFYTLFDAAHRPYKLLRHQVGNDPLQDELVFHEPDDAYMMFVERSRSGKFILMTLQSHSTSEVHALRAHQPASVLQVLHPRQHWLEYYADHHAERFIIRTNADGATNFKLVEAPVDSPGKENWREILSHREDTLLESIQVFNNFLVVQERQGGLRKLRLSNPDGISQVRYIPLPDPVYTLRLDENPEYDTQEVRFFYSSLVTPESTVDVDVQTNAWQVRKQQEIPSGYDPGEYISERLFARAPDGKLVPLSIVYRQGLKKDGNNPLLLYGYGSYGYSVEPGFDSRRLSLLDRGYVFAIAHIRGGNELGRSWYEDGRLMHKKNSFSDFIACAEYLVAESYTNPDRMGIMGGSAGGLLVSAVANLRPDLFKAVVALVPFTNLITAMLMPDLPLTVIEYEQWGNPNDAQAFDYMLSYSPYENVTARSYPHILVRAGINDLQVPYWDPAKWVARLRALKTDKNRLLLLTNMSAGHGGSSGRYEHLREDAENYAFLIDTL